MIEILRATREVWLATAKAPGKASKPKWAFEKYGKECCPFCVKFMTVSCCSPIGFVSCPIGPMIGVGPADHCERIYNRDLASYFHKWAFARIGSRKERSAAWMMANAMSDAIWNKRMN